MDTRFAPSAVSTVARAQPTARGVKRGASWVPRDMHQPCVFCPGNGNAVAARHVEDMRHSAATRPSGHVLCKQVGCSQRRVHLVSLCSAALTSCTFVRARSRRATRGRLACACTQCARSRNRSPTLGSSRALSDRVRDQEVAEYVLMDRMPNLQVSARHGFQSEPTLAVDRSWQSYLDAVVASDETIYTLASRCLAPVIAGRSYARRALLTRWSRPSQQSRRHS